MRTRQFFVSGRWFAVYLTGGLIGLVLGATEVFSGVEWWRRAFATVWIACGAWNCYLAWLARVRPMVAISDSDIVMRAPAARRLGRLLLTDVAGLAWWNPGSLGLRLRDGATLTVNLIGLSTEDKASIRDLLANGRSGA